MFGINSKFKCPCCKYTGVVDLGITNFINIKDKGEHFAIRNCPKCHKSIAFHIVKDENRFFFGDSYSGNHNVINCIQNTIDNLSEKELLNEELLKTKVLTELSKIVSLDYIDKYIYEITTIIEKYSAKLTTPDIEPGIELSTINKEDIEDDGTICF